MTAAGERVILCFGDSNTHGTVAMPGPDAKARRARNVRWPGIMAAALGPGYHVVEEGHPGRTTVHADAIEGAHKSGLAALPTLLETHRPIDLVVLMLGTNDLKYRVGVSASDIAASVERLGRDFLRSDAGPDGGAPDLVVVCPTAIEESGWLAPMFEGGAAKSRSLPPLVAHAAERLGAGFVDAGQHAGVDLLDGVHLTEDGHARLGAAVAEAVQARLGA